MPAHDVKQELRKFLNASYADITQRKIQAAKSDQKELLEETIHQISLVMGRLNHRNVQSKEK
jgi:hypothetical protein